MAKRLIRIAAAIAGVGLAGTLSWSVIAQGDAVAGHGGGFLRHLHQLGHQLHGDGHDPGEMGRLIEQLDLNPDQQRHLEKIHEIVGNHGGRGAGPMVELHERLLSQFREGQVDAGEIKQIVDGHVEEIRGMAYGVTDELVALLNGLDTSQREILLNHLEEAGGPHDIHGH